MKTILTAVFMLFTTMAFSQMYIQKEVDEMDGTASYSYSENVYTKDGEKEALVILAIQGDLKPHTFAVISRGIGDCVDDSELVVLFKDGTRFIASSWNDFNCEGRSYFNITRQIASQLASKPVDKIRIKNGRSSESFTFEIEDPRYFIEAYALAEAGIVRNK